jgi:hypothetical protein
MSEFINKYLMGMVIEDFTPDAINRAIDSLLYLNLQSMRERAYRAALDHSWEVQERRMISAFEELKCIKGIAL